jgi:hypothetical protein
MEGRRAETFGEHDQAIGDSVIGENAKHKAALSAVETHEANNKLDVRIACWVGRAGRNWDVTIRLSVLTSSFKLHSPRRLRRLLRAGPTNLKMYSKPSVQNVS